MLAAVRERLFEAPNDEVDSWVLSNNPALIFGVLGTYWMFVYKVGPTFMRDRKPYDPKRLIMAYNVVQVVVCLGMVLWVSVYANRYRFNTVVVLCGLN